MNPTARIRYAYIEARLLRLQLLQIPNIAIQLNLQWEKLRFNNYRIIHFSGMPTIQDLEIVQYLRGLTESSKNHIFADFPTQAWKRRLDPAI